MRKLIEFVEEAVGVTMWATVRNALLLSSLIGHSLANTQDQSRKLQAPTVGVHGFRVDVAFSEKAMKKLSESRETVIAIAYFTGSPRADIPFEQYKQFASRPGPIRLGEAEVEVFPGETMNFSAPKLKRHALAFIDSQGPQLLINVVSGRKSSKDNLLDCDIYEGPLKAAEGTSIPIHCKLIRGE
jgi:hypothetical protein